MASILPIQPIMNIFLEAVQTVLIWSPFVVDACWLYIHPSTIVSAWDKGKHDQQNRDKRSRNHGSFAYFLQILLGYQQHQQAVLLDLILSYLKIQSIHRLFFLRISLQSGCLIPVTDQCRTIMMVEPTTGKFQHLPSSTI